MVLWVPRTQRYTRLAAPGLSCPLLGRTATSRKQAVTPENAGIFLFAPNLLYLLVFAALAEWPVGLTGSGLQKTPDPQKRDFAGSGNA
jgi:hypothetical protein